MSDRCQMCSALVYYVEQIWRCRCEHQAFAFVLLEVQFMIWKKLMENCLDRERRRSLIDDDATSSLPLSPEPSSAWCTGHAAGWKHLPRYPFRLFQGLSVIVLVQWEWSSGGGVMAPLLRRKIHLLGIVVSDDMM